MTADADVPRSRRERPAKPALTRAGIVAAAVELMRAEGLERVTMRRLAQQLDTGPASLYVYVRNTAELHAAVLDELLGAVELAPEGAGDWRDRLVRVLTSYVDVLFAHPALARSALVARPSGAHYLDLVEALLALLAEGGVPRREAAWALDLLLQHATATAAEQATRGQDTEAQDDWDALTAAVRGAADERHPQVATHGDELLSGTPQQRLSWGFHVLIGGILATPAPE
ncbi:TetR family transcriptional regulator [Streptomyces sp. AcH 505]|uniref:TetR/AcrR family transcriptional regulator n=1 Tax=Streptomyces sp. AcH 505 TaxID=352211 RepID=UPI000591D558|nr:TetR family transcriptional regulator [Streptomyces sp. AcH 505]